MVDKTYEDLFGKRFFYKQTKKFLFGLISLTEIIEDKYPDKQPIHSVSHGRYLHNLFIRIFNYKYNIEYSNNEFRSLEILRKNHG